MSTEQNPKKGSSTPKSDSKKTSKKVARGRKAKRKKPEQRGSGGSEIDLEAVERANQRFDIKPLPMGLPDNLEPAPKKVQIKWKLTPVPTKVERSVHDIVCRPGEFGFLDDERVDEIAELIKGKQISLEQALSLRAALNQEKAVFSHGRLQRRAREMQRKYKAGEGVLSLSKRYDFPPVNLFRAILSARNWSKNRIKEALKEPEKKLNKRDLEQFRKAEAEDRVTHVNQSEAHHAADLFETVLCDHFTANGVRYRTQNELLKEQVAAEGRPVRTPDLLMLDHVEINGVPVAWIDAKHFYGANSSWQRRKTQKQVNRYVEEWGHGAIIYRHGFCAGLKLKGAILLDASPIDLSKLIKHNQRLKDERTTEG
ncbi:MAG: hypothetical protein CMB37_02510 [Euryarchaeota archaeon]|nr:hypothetical protein [Euryarchaeota archaeon]